MINFFLDFCNKKCHLISTIKVCMGKHGKDTFECFRLVFGQDSQDYPVPKLCFGTGDSPPKKRDLRACVGTILQGAPKHAHERTHPREDWSLSDRSSAEILREADNGGFVLPQVAFLQARLKVKPQVRGCARRSPLRGCCHHCRGYCCSSHRLSAHRPGCSHCCCRLGCRCKPSQ